MRRRSNRGWSLRCFRSRRRWMDNGVPANALSRFSLCPRERLFPRVLRPVPSASIVPILYVPCRCRLPLFIFLRDPFDFGSLGGLCSRAVFPCAVEQASLSQSFSSSSHSLWTTCLGRRCPLLPPCMAPAKAGSRHSASQPPR